MKCVQVSRREFVALAAAVVPLRLRASLAPISAEQIAARIGARLGSGGGRAGSEGGIRAGDPSTPVTGIATTAMATVDVLRKAKAAGRNFVVTQDPVFYSATDTPGDRANDPVLLAKKKLIEDEHMVVYRLSDQWSARRPSESATALADVMGWSASRVPTLEHTYTVADTTVGALAAALRSTLGVRGGMRIVGAAAQRVRTVFLSPETTTLAAAVRNLPHADVIVAGEPREWEAVPYTLDWVTAGRPKALIALGRVVSENAGMRACAQWLASFVAEVPIAAVDVADPYWSALS